MECPLYSVCRLFLFSSWHFVWPTHLMWFISLNFVVRQTPFLCSLKMFWPRHIHCFFSCPYIIQRLHGTCKHVAPLCHTVIESGEWGKHNSDSTEAKVAKKPHSAEFLEDIHIQKVKCDVLCTFNSGIDQLFGVAGCPFLWFIIFCYSLLWMWHAATNVC